MLKKIATAILFMFVMSFFAIAGAHDYTFQGSAIANMQGLDEDNPPPPEEPPDKHHKKHHEKELPPAPEPKPNPDPAPPAPEPAP